MKEKKIKQAMTSGVAKVPIILQLEATECGAASLAMIMAYYEKWVPIAQVRQDCGVSRDGSTALNIKKAAQNYGFKVNAFKMEPESLRKKGTYPCMIFCGFNHFSVLNGFKGDKAYINDPAKGIIKVPMSEFDKMFTGIVLMFEPGEQFEPSGKRLSILTFAAERLKGSKASVIFVILTTLIAGLFGIIMPVFTRVFLDRMLTGKNTDQLLPFIGLLTFVTLLKLLVDTINAIYSLRIQGKMDVDGSTSYIWKVLHLPIGFFSQRLAGDISSRQQLSAKIAQTLVTVMAPMVLQAAMVLFYLIVMLRHSVILTLIGVAGLAINVLLGRYISNQTVQISRVRMRDFGKVQSATIGGIEVIETLKACGSEDGYFARWAGFQASVNKEDVEIAKLNATIGSLPELVKQIVNLAILGLGILLVTQGKFMPGMVLVFQMYLVSIEAPISSMIASGQSIHEMVTQMERLDDVMKYPESKVFAAKGSDGAPRKKLTGRLEMKNVTFGYSPLGEPLIRDFNLTLDPGKRVAFVGASGSGKSTLGNLITGMYAPWSGEILYDGRSIEDIDHAVFTDSIAKVDQDIYLFNDTIESNIRMWDSGLEDIDMIDAARKAQIHKDIMAKPGSYHHILQEGGREFSGGQRQRIEIARALAQNPTLLVLDEATSALDADTEAQVVQGIVDSGVTCIMIAHRLSTIRDCDEIIVMDRGKVVERGRHEELYAAGGLYTQLISSE